MLKSSRSLLPVLTFLAAALAAAGCGPANTGAPPAPPVQPSPNTAASSGIKAVMMKFNGPQAIPAKIGADLKADSPPWDDLQKETSDLSKLAAALAQNTPAKGTKEQWDKHTKDFADRTAALDAAVQAKDAAKARDLHSNLNTSCGECHRDHRGRGVPMPAG